MEIERRRSVHAALAAGNHGRADTPVGSGLHGPRTVNAAANPLREVRIPVPGRFGAVQKMLRKVQIFVSSDEEPLTCGCHEPV